MSINFLVGPVGGHHPEHRVDLRPGDELGDGGARRVGAAPQPPVEGIEALQRVLESVPHKVVRLYHDGRPVSEYL